MSRTLLPRGRPAQVAGVAGGPRSTSAARSGGPCCPSGRPPSR